MASLLQLAQKKCQYHSIPGNVDAKQTLWIVISDSDRSSAIMIFKKRRSLSLSLSPSGQVQLGAPIWPYSQCQQGYPLKPCIYCIALHPRLLNPKKTLFPCSWTLIMHNCWSYACWMQVVHGESVAALCIVSPAFPVQFAFSPCSLVVVRPLHSSNSLGLTRRPSLP